MNPEQYPRGNPEKDIDLSVPATVAALLCYAAALAITRADILSFFIQ